MNKTTALFLALQPLLWAVSQAQEVPILSHEIDANGQARLTVASTEDHYYVLHVRHEIAGAFEQATSIVKGKNGETVLTEPLAAYPEAHYKITEHLTASPADTDGDGQNDMAELAELGKRSPFNVAPPINYDDGAVFIADRIEFKKLAFHYPQNAQSPVLEDVEEVKFFIKNRNDDEPILYFINSKTHGFHTDFANALGYFNDGTLMTGSIVFHPHVVAPNGTLGLYRFVFQPNDAFSIKMVQKAMELLAANMPFLKNNFLYYPIEPGGLPKYFQEKILYDASRVGVLLESELFADLDYLALHPAEGFGLLKWMKDEETPGSRDIVLYESLPNDLPRVGGIITTVVQTPLSHVNLRAIQDNVPNAFIRDATLLPGIDSLFGRYVYYKVEQSDYTIREATQKEVDDFYDAIRPKKPQIPVRDLSQTKIKALDDISFEESASFGVKCANVATMRGFGFPAGTIPDGFGVPFYFYDEFMKHNGFYQEAQTMLAEADFQYDFNTRIIELEKFRKKIKDAPMPQWMMDDLSAMQQSFPPETPIRCRSSTNNEDLPGFSGAGLYDSKTQHPDEGHISKSIKQVYASMWNFRAFEEREFYRIDHFRAAMGVLVHPNFEGEKANGVGVSIDPIYQTNGNFYLNTQVGEDLVTNPNALSIPEEILLEAPPTGSGFFVISHSNQVPADSLILKPQYLSQMREFLGTVHDKFKTLYGAENREGFAMEIEYKINADGQLTIKQARPWANFWTKQEPPGDTLALWQSLSVFPNPFEDVVNIECACESVVSIEIFDLLGHRVGGCSIDFRKNQRQISMSQLVAGAYFLRGTDAAGGRYFSGILVKGR